MIVLSILITTLSRAEVVRQFTDGAEATLLVTEGGHISYANEGSGSEGTANGSSFPNVVGMPSPTTHSPFFYYETKLVNRRRRNENKI